MASSGNTGRQFLQTTTPLDEAVGFKNTDNQVIILDCDGVVMISTPFWLKDWQINPPKIH